MARAASSVLASALAVLAMSLLQGSVAGPLHEAAEAGDLKTLDALVTSGALLEELDAAGNTPLIAATLSGRRDAVARLLDAGASVDGRSDRGMTALHAAAYGGYADIAALLIERGADVNNGQNKFGIGPLHAAAEENHLPIVELLIARGADVDLPEGNGITPLTRAGWREHWEIVSALKRAGAACQPRELVGDWLHDRCISLNP